MKNLSGKFLGSMLSFLFLYFSYMNSQELTKTDIDTTKSFSLFNGKTLDGWEKTNFGPQGPVYPDKGAIILGIGEGCTGINWIKDFPKINYEVTLEAQRVTGYDFFCGMTFPVNEDHCTLIIGGWGGSVVGLSSIDGLDASENNTTFIRSFTNKRWYDIRLKVTPDAIGAWIDGRNVVDFSIGDHELSVRPEVELCKPFGICSWYTKAALRNIKVHLLKNE
jgi:hypothetical protein